RTGDIPKSRFYTDSIMVASEHAELDLGGEPVLRSLARHCFTFVRRDGQILALAPREAADGRHELPLLPNDEVLVGNCLFQVSYPPPAGQAAPVATPPAPAIPRPSAGELASLVDMPTAAGAPTIPLPAPDAPTENAPRPSFRSHNTYDPAVAAGLGEAGPPPRPPRLGEPGARDNGTPPGMRPNLADLVKPPGDAPPADAPTAETHEKKAGKAEKKADPLRLRNAASLPDLAEPPPIPVGPAAASSARRGLAGGSPTPPILGPIPLAASPPSDPGSPTPFARPAAAAKPPDAPRADAAKPPPPMLLDEPREAELPLFEEVEGFDDGEPVLAVEEARWKLELARPAKLVQVGWMVSGEVIVGNHGGAQVIVPEVRAFREQAFLTLDYFKVSVRGRKGKIELLQEGEAGLSVNGATVPATDDLQHAELTIVRRDANLEPDFDVTLRVLRDESLPDPRAQLVAIDTTDRLVAALFTLGFPLRADRRLRVGRVVATFRWDGTRLRVSDYLSTYRTEAGFLPVFLKSGDRPWQTFPEDGARVDLAPGDGLIVGNAVYRFQAG
ncbi:MAG: hypothetical protein ACK4YP_03565, partial [Myxococcota bacterium]